MKRHKNHCFGICYLVLLALTAGCQPSADTSSEKSDHSHGHGHDHDHDHGHRPKTLAAAIEKLQDMRDQIQAAMEKDDADAAHEPLHEVGTLLKAMPDLAADTDLAEDEWNELKTHADQLFDAFSDVDAVFHQKDGDKQKAYDEAKSAIDEELAVLISYLPKLDGGGVSIRNDHDSDDDHADHEEHDDEEHDHDEHDHDEHDHDEHDHDEHDHDEHEHEELEK